MRVISGKYKSRLLLGDNLKKTRPTMDRVKMSLFSMINNYIDEAVILDLFAGSGSLSIEALSNNSKYAYLVDNNKDACNIINKNMNNLEIANYKLLNSDYKNALKYFYDNNIKFNIIFLDPPYDSNYIKESIILIDKYNLLEDNGIIVLESDNNNKLIYDINKYKIYKERKYSEKIISILKKI